MRRVEFDVAHPRSHGALVETDGVSNRPRQAVDARHVPRAIGQRLLRPVLQDEERLPPEMRPRTARDGEEIYVLRADAADLQAGLDRPGRESGDMFDAEEALLFDGGDKLSVADERRQDVAVIRVETEDVHATAA